MQEPNKADFRPARESSSGLKIVILIILALLAAGFFWWRWQQQQVAALPPVVGAAPPDSAVQPDKPAQPAPAESSGPLNPLAVIAQPDAALPALADSDARVANALEELLGRKQVASFLQLDGFVRRVVATVDNLPRQDAASRIWPVQVTPQRFTVDGAADAQAIAPTNAARYTPFVTLLESVDAAKLATFYARFYPLFQQAYEELGYPGRYFNDRLVAVLDHLLQAPEPASPVRVRLIEVKGSVPSERPWVRYEFADPQLEALSSGQKMLVRMGLANERRVKARIAELRRQVATGSVARPAKAPD